MTFSVRVAVKEDVPGMHRVRLGVRENRLLSSAVQEKLYTSEIEHTGRGWVAVENNEVLGFAVGNMFSGNIWALFVDPRHERRGIGRCLQESMILWLFSTGLRRLWLSTDPNTRAQSFYLASGWQFVRILPHGEAMCELHAPGAA
jgi:GNAT superfamily N-acetyltransferase